MINFEVPATEQIRICLRLEQLYTKAQFFLRNDDEWHSKACVEAVLDMLQLLDRPEVRNKFAQEVTRIKTNLQRFQPGPQVDPAKFQQVFHKLNEVSSTIHSSNGKFAESLRQNEFVKTLSLQHSIPGGISEYHLPEYQYWLLTPFQSRQAQLEQWLTAFKDILSITSLLLGLARECAVTKSTVAKEGFYQTTMDPQQMCQIIGIGVDPNDKVYPILSLGRHGVSIRFIKTDADERSQQTRRDIPFQFSYSAF